jgi:hypothetical protein
MLSVRSSYGAKLIDAALLVCWLGTVGTVLWITDAPWMVANALVLGLPLTYILARSGRARMMIRWTFVVKYVLFVTVFFDYLCVRYRAWSGATIFPWTLAEGVNVEQVTWTILLIPLTIAVNEHFFSRPCKVPQRRFTRRVLGGLFFAGLAVALISPLHGWLATYTYLKIGIMLYPVVFILAFVARLRIASQLIAIGAVMGLFNLGFELLALHNHFWTFPGIYVGFVRVLGYMFPVEELVFLVCLCSPAVVATYALYKNWKSMLPVESAGDPMSPSGAPSSHPYGSASRDGSLVGSVFDGPHVHG